MADNAFLNRPKTKVVTQQQPWIYSAWVDGVFIIAPAFVSLAIVFLLADKFRRSNAMPDYTWVILVVLIDVAHVYSTLYRTYLDKETFRLQRSLLVNVPIIAFVVGVVLYSLDDMLFWRMLAYLAVFHFVRQQYGFLRIYSRKENQPHTFSSLDTIVIYAATLYPILYWHLSSPRNFNWFIAGDFWHFQSGLLLQLSAWLYGGLIVLYFFKEFAAMMLHRYYNLPKLGIMVGTIVSWYFGIVYFNGDLAFTLLNVVAHGIPYMALIWVYGRKKTQSLIYKPSAGLLKSIFTTYGLVLFLGVLFLLAYVEEGFWDALVWNDHPVLFQLFYVLPQVSSQTLLAFIVPLLALPQMTHYVLDGFIWKMSKGEAWKKEVLP
jgi:hypothetical protein